ncbi:hypothetical protein SNE40_021549 [Patella caerulea]|uniref:Cadherin domain-containing protein n=1 Tax=Patella caerulea TaxID=87958 RepID=A0AAN8IWT6_PATCE
MNKGCCLKLFIILLYSLIIFGADFDPMITNVYETETNDRTIATVITTDCSLDRTKGPFKLDGNDVVFKYGSGYPTLNYSKTPSYELCVTCGTGTTTSSCLEVDVHPNSPPVFQDWPIKTLTLKAVDTGEDESVYTVQATDPDSTDNLVYELIDIPTDYKDYFTLDETTGEIKTAIDLKYATVDTIPIKVNVSDGKNEVGPMTVVVRLTDLNPRPVFTNLPANVTIPEDAEAGDTIITLTFNDANIVDRTNFDPVCSVFPNSESYKFNYDTTSSKLKLVAVPDGDTLLDYESTNFYNISCVVNDGYLDSEGAYINLFVENINEAPTFNKDLYTCNLYESEAGVSNCDLPITITDEEGQSYNTILLSGNNSERFRLDQNTNKLTFNTNYDVDENAMPETVVVTVAAVDSRGKTGTSKIQINVRDVNDNDPDFGLNSQQSISVGADTGLGILGSVTADDIDSDNNGEVTYTLAGGSVSALAYVNVLNTGEIMYTNKYDYSLAGQTHYLEVLAKDKGSPQRTSTATVAVQFQTTTTTTTAPTGNQNIQVINNSGTSGSSSSSSNSGTSSSSSSSVLDDSTNVALLATLLSLLALAGLAGLLCCCCRGGCFSGGGGNSLCDCECFKKKTVKEEYHRRIRLQPRRVEQPKAIEPPPKTEIVEEVEEIERPQQYIVEEVLEEPRVMTSNSYGYTSSTVPYYNHAYNGYYY